MSIPHRRTITLFVFSLFCSGATHAAVVWYEARGTFARSNFPNQIAVGDKFSVSFAYDNSATDANPNTLAGRFPGALVHFDFRLLPGAIGSYAPAAATVFQPIDTFDGVGDGAAALPDRFYLAASGGNFGLLNGHAFGGVLFVLDDYSHTSSIHDTGAGQTLASQVGALNLQPFKATVLQIIAEGKNGMAEANITELEVRPPPILKVTTQNSGKLRFAWSTNQPNYIVESTLSLGTPNWRRIDSPKVIEGPEFSVVIDGNEGLFRLRSE